MALLHFSLCLCKRKALNYKPRREGQLHEQCRGVSSPGKAGGPSRTGIQVMGSGAALGIAAMPHTALQPALALGLDVVFFHEPLLALYGMVIITSH